MEYFQIPNKYKMTHREIFVYLIVALAKDPNIAVLGVDRRTVILDELRKKICPSVTDDDWSWIAREIDSNNEELGKLLKSMMTGKDFTTLYTNIMERFEKRKRLSKS